MKALLNWLDTRTGVHHLMHEALYERVPGGARWRYVWGSTLVFAFITQAITGLFLWMCYSPSAQTAWESVYYIQFQMQGGWLLRGIHHFMAQAMIVLMALHLMQVVIDGAYRAPREVNFWLGLVLMQIVLGLSLTGYLLPWDQKGYWATRVATNLLSIVPVVGPQLQQLVVGGSDYGHHTLTRFFALHAGLLPALLVAALVPHVALFRRHGLCARHPLKGPETTFWPDQVLKDGVACLAVLIVVLVLVVHPLDHFFASGADSHAVAAGAHLGAELGAPADSSEQYSAARPEWYFLFLFQFLKLFEGWGEHGELLGAIVIPGAVMTALFFMPFIGRWKLGHGFNVGLLVVLFACIGLLTMAAMTEDYNALWTNESEFTDVPEILDKVGSDPQKIADYFNNDPARIAEFATQAKEYDHFAKSKSYLQAVKEAEREAERIVTLAASPSLIPSTGAITLLRNDPKTQGPKLFARNCAGCHAWQPPAGAPDDPQTPRDPSAPNLYGFASRAWIAGLLDPKKIEGPEYFGKTAHREGQMVGFVKENAHEWPASQVHDIVIALSAEAQLKSQLLVDQRDAALIVTGKALIAQEDRCVSCHKFGAAGELGAAPDLTNYGSRAWLIGMIRDPKHERYYRDENDRMPSFAAAPGDSEKNKLSEHAIGLIADWLRGTWYEPGDTVPATEVVASESAAEPHEKPAQPAAEVAPAESTPNDTPNPEPVTPDPKPETPPTEPTPKPNPTPTPEPAPKPEPTPPPDPKPAEPEPASKPPEPAPKPDDPSPPSAAS